jgi:hypothetical protein
MLALTVLCPALLFVGVWSSSGLQMNDAPIILVWLGSLAALAVVVTLAFRAHRSPGALRVGCVGLVAVALVGLVYWTVSGGLVSAKLQPDVASWQQALHQIDAVEPTAGCKPPVAGLSMAGLGSVTQVCVLGPTVDSGGAVVFSGSTSSASLFHYPHSGWPPAYDDCVRKASGQWWQAIPIGSSLSCPAGFRFVGGP